MRVSEFIQSLQHLPLDEMNKRIELVCGISDFFIDSNDIDICVNDERDGKEEYGDWQTNTNLAHRIVNQISHDCQPQVVIEPTCGKGNFVLAALDMLPSIEDIFAIEIYKPYLQFLKMEILQLYLTGTLTKKIRFHFYHSSIFEIEWGSIKSSIGNRKLLVLGNPPWVTNSALSRIDSKNLPAKSNFKQVKGLSAMMGKGNFDIAEYICYDLFKQFAKEQNYFALLLKNSVIKQICFYQNKMQIPINALRQYEIDAKKEFGASVDASLFVCQAGQPSKNCKVFDFYSLQYKKTFGWVNQKFVSDIETYGKYSSIDGVCPFQWWSGVKHDCQSVVELTKSKNGFYNTLGELVNIEEDYIYPYVKSSDIQKENPTASNRYIIITQHKINDNTEQLQHIAPLTYNYLLLHRDFFDKRKSAIYKNRSSFCMFGIGDYTFKPYKIVISSLYKHPHFSLLKPVKGKCVIPDDTCYQIGFDKEEDALAVLALLSNSVVKNFIESTSFNDSKRMITKELLMRIDLVSVERRIAISQGTEIEQKFSLSSLIGEAQLFTPNSKNSNNTFKI